MPAAPLKITKIFAKISKHKRLREGVQCQHWGYRPQDSSQERKKGREGEQVMTSHEQATLAKGLT